MIGWKIKKSHFNQENLAKAEFFDGFLNIHEHKRYYYTFNQLNLLFTKAFRHYPKSC